MHRTPGGLAAGGLFVLPGVIALMVLSWIYVIWGEVSVVAGLFFGLKAAVLAVVIEAVLRVGRRALKTHLAFLIAGLAFVALFAFAVPFPLVVLTAAIIGVAAHRMGYAVGAPTSHGSHGNDRLGETIPSHATPTFGRAVRVASVWLPLWLGPVVLLLVFVGWDNVFSRLAVFFSEVAVVTFGGAYAVLAYVAQEAVGTYHWLRPGEMLAGLGMAETTPGPLIMVVQYVGFLAGYRAPGVLSPLLAGTLAGLLVTWVTFTPCFLWVFLGAPYIEALRGARGLNAALSAVTAAVVGVVLNLAMWFGIHVIFHDTVLGTATGWRSTFPSSRASIRSPPFWRSPLRSRCSASRSASSQPCLDAPLRAFSCSSRSAVSASPIRTQGERPCDTTSHPSTAARGH